ncbi:MAG: hypothetical protein AAFW98_13565, partial [Pseudomonadota bacterium]
MNIFRRSRQSLTAGAAICAILAPLAASAQEAGEPIREIILWGRTQAANPQAYTAAQLIAQAWEKLGLEVDVRGIPRPQLSDIVWYTRDGWDTTMWQMVGRPERSDPDELVYNLFHSTTAPSGYNFVGYSNPEFDKVAELQRVETDEEHVRLIVGDDLLRLFHQRLALILVGLHALQLGDLVELWVR